MAPNQGRILVVDDESIVRESIATVLAYNGFTVVEAESASDAWAKHAESRCDLLLVDKNLPGESGIELVRRLRAAADMVPVIVMTGFGSVESAIEGLHLRIGAYVEKPFEDIFSIATTVDQVLRRHGEIGVGAKGAISHFRSARAALQGLSAGAVDSPAGRATGPEAGVALRLVVVSPVAADRDALARLVAGAGDDVVRCATSTEGLAALAQGGADLAVVDADVRSPDVFDFVERARTGSTAPVCAVLASAPTLDFVRRLIGLDVRAVIEKPVDGQQARERLAPLLAQLRAPSA